MCNYFHIISSKGKIVAANARKGKASPHLAFSHVFRLDVVMMKQTISQRKAIRRQEKENGKSDLRDEWGRKRQILYCITIYQKDTKEADNLSPGRQKGPECCHIG